MPLHPLRRLTAPLLAVLIAAAVIPLGVAGADDDHDDDTVVVRSPIAASQPSDPALFGVLPGTAPWAIDRGSVRVGDDGRVRLRVRRLVIPTPPANGTNPVPLLSASVACNGTIVGRTPTVPFSPRGDARIDADIGELPSPCAAPAVLVHPNDNATRYIAFGGVR